MGELVLINKYKLAVKEYQGKRVVTFREIDSVHEKSESSARKRFYKNKKRFELGKDYFVLSKDEAHKYGIMAPNGLVLITENGYRMIVKTFEDDLAWEVQRQLVDSYFRPQTIQQPTTQIEALLQTVQILAKQEKQIFALEETQSKQEQTIQNIKDALLPADKEWRKYINEQVNKIAKSRGDDYQGTRQESYELLENRAACDLGRRVKNYKERLFEAGSSKTKINGVCRLDVIEQDKRLKEIYSAIVKELSIKYVA